ncbi:hypothetical protein [Kitasatospora sp. CB01950]|uniref:hypothetical protein n=1 Tax=Kitasatospora sp. CB01950 TaxID=1703930 RepID=UPI00093D881C|nr:hypothetical protein [Kitasatospora sp. CB01950]OKJ10385.1 hypothetical protein AMK19_16180 [Kitasatospora sp. CB01950]
MTSPDRTPSTSHFEQRLGEELTALAAERGAATASAARPSGRRRPLLAAVAVGAAAVVTALVLPAVLSSEHGGSAAYAVTQEPDGTIALKLFDPAGLPGMVATLQRYGVKAAGMEEARSAEECPLPYPVGTGVQPSRVVPGDGPSTVRIDPKLVPAGSTVLLTSGHTAIGGQAVSSFGVRAVDTVPSCVPPGVWGKVAPSGPPTASSPTLAVGPGYGSSPKS